MSYNNGIITAPISTSEPYYVMGVGVYNGVFDLAYICSNQHGKINKWSEYKPFIFNSPFSPTLDQIKFINYGLKDPDVSVDIETASKKEYVYQAPNRATDWKRLTDFDKYNHYATPPCVGVGDYIIDLFFQNTQTFQFMYGFDGISLNNFKGLLQDYYICFAIKSYRNGVAYYDYKTTSKTIGQGAAAEVTFDLKSEPPFSNQTNFSDSIYFWCAANKPKINSYDAEPSMQNFLPLPFATSADSTGKIKYKQVTSDSWNPRQISTGYNDRYIANINFFIGLPTEASLYFQLNNSGDIYYTFEVTNNNTYNSTYYIANFRCEARPSWANANNTYAPTGLYIPNFYMEDINTGTWNKLSESFSIPPQSTVKIRLGVPKLLSFYNGNSYPMKVGKGGLTFEIEYNGVPFQGTPALNVELK